MLNASTDRISDATFYVKFDCGAEAGIENTLLAKFAYTQQEAMYVNMFSVDGKDPFTFILSTLQRLGGIDVLSTVGAMANVEEGPDYPTGIIARLVTFPIRAFRWARGRKAIQWPICHILNLAKRLKAFCYIVDAVEQAVKGLTITIPSEIGLAYPIAIQPWVDQTRNTGTDVEGNKLPGELAVYRDNTIPFIIKDDVIDDEGATYWWLVVGTFGKSKGKNCVGNFVVVMIVYQPHHRLTMRLGLQ